MFLVFVCVGTFPAVISGEWAELLSDHLQVSLNDSLLWTSWIWSRESININVVDCGTESLFTPDSKAEQKTQCDNLFMMFVTDWKQDKDQIFHVFHSLLHSLLQTLLTSSSDVETWGHRFSPAVYYLLHFFESVHTEMTLFLVMSNKIFIYIYKIFSGDPINITDCN